MKEDYIEYYDKCDIAADLSTKTSKRLMEMEHKIDTTIQNQHDATIKIDSIIVKQEEFKEDIDDIKIKMNKMYDALIGNELSENQGLIHRVKHMNSRMIDIEKFIDKIKTFWWGITIVTIIIGFAIEQFITWITRSGLKK
jgi:hypothetical protein